MVGDTIIEIDGERVYYSGDFSTFMSMSQDDTVDMTIVRDGEKIELKDFELKKNEFSVNGENVYKYGINFEVIEGNFISRLKYSCYSTYNFVRFVRLGLVSLFTGTAGLQDMSGVVGIVDMISDVGNASATASIAASNIAYLAAFIAVNLAVMNMLPIPALDGGRVFFLLITWIVERISHKKVPSKYEAYIHAGGLVVLLLLMGVVMVNDIVRIVNG